MFDKRLIPLILLATLLPSPEASAQGRRADFDRVELKEWIRGPVLYIATREETKAFRSFRSDRDRALFIERFWRRRDPEPETLANPARKQFWDRVAEANRLYLDSSAPGWKTDRGKIHILYGPPSHIEDALNAKVASTGVGMIRWIYQGRPSERKDIDNDVIIPFVRDGSGEYRVSYDPKLISPAFNPHMYRPGEDPLENYFTSLDAPSRSPLSVMLDLGRLQEVPPEAAVFLDRVETSESYQSEPLPAVVTRYVHPERDDIMSVSFTVGLATQTLDRPARILARVHPTGRPGEARILDDSSFRFSGEGGRRVAQARMQLEPGEYDLMVMAVDGVRAVTSVHRGRFDVPRPGRTIHLSDVTLASMLEPVAYRALIDYDEPFHVGPYRVVPAVDPALRPGGAIRLFYEVYEAAPPLRISYQVEGEELDGTWKRLGQPMTSQQEVTSQGWELQTTARWPEGSYRVVIEVVDAEGRQVRQMVPFRLATDAAPTVATAKPTSEGDEDGSQEPR